MRIKEYPYCRLDTFEALDSMHHKDKTSSDSRRKSHNETLPHQINFEARPKNDLNTFESYVR